MLENYKDILTPQDLYEILPIGKNGVYKMLENNVIPSLRIGRKILIPKQSLIDFLKTT